ncbi:MAG TPA: hypothetical protein VMX97_10305 [Hyphomicrobiaceae bacterium]|nr:hypothetical protein [Hyphomicrobiaceae bacterium]
MSSLTLITAPAALPLTLSELKAGARLDGIDDDDALIMGYLRSAVQQIDGRDGGGGLALITQVWDYKLDAFPLSNVMPGDPYGAVRVPLSPLQSVGSISYVDLAGATQTLSASLYQVVGNGGDSRPKIVPAWGQTWPDTRDQPEAVTVRFTAGYGDDANDVPEPIRQALTLMVQNAYDGCESDGPGRLLEQYMMFMRPGALPSLAGSTR